MKAPTPHSNHQQPRRQFLKTSGTLVGGVAAMPFPALAQSPKPYDQFSVGIIGPGGMGMAHIRKLASYSDVRIAAVCDADEQRTSRAAQLTEEISGRRPQAFRDMRKVLEMQEIDAVFIATPDHWHAPATILACDAGKHVYVEKPASHNIREGRLMIEAARRNNRIVQVGTQSRSTKHVMHAMELLHNGAIGEILTAKVWNSQRRGNIGKTQASDPPTHLDFDLWLGPAKKVPYRSNMLHSIWRWWYDFGTGDMGNDGVHDLDIGRWGLGMETHPNRITALGGKYFFDDDQQFPDTQNVLFEYAAASKSGRPKQLSFEQRIWSPYVQEGHENGNAFYGTEGMMILGKGKGWKLYGPRNELREEMKGSPDLEAHHHNFFECIRTGKQANADIKTGHLSSSLCHLGNIATRIGRVIHLDTEKEIIKDDKEANTLVSKVYREHWAKPNVL